MACAYWFTASQELSYGVDFCDLQPDAPLPTNQPCTKTGYSGHLPGRTFSSNFLLAYNIRAGFSAILRVLALRSR